MVLLTRYSLHPLRRGYWTVAHFARENTNTKSRLSICWNTFFDKKHHSMDTTCCDNLIHLTNMQCAVAIWSYNIARSPRILLCCPCFLATIGTKVFSRSFPQMAKRAVTVRIDDDMLAHIHLRVAARKVAQCRPGSEPETGERATIQDYIAGAVRERLLREPPPRIESLSFSSIDE